MLEGHLDINSLLEPVLVIAAHPDDEVLGCGGTIARLAQSGQEVFGVFLADGVSARASELDSVELKRRRAATEAAATVLGIKAVTFGEFPDNRMDGVDLLEVVQFIEPLIAQYQPQTVITHHGGDLNIDHQRSHQAVLTACRPQPGYPVKTLLFFEVPSSTEWQTPGSAPVFTPNWFVDITNTLALKQEALAAYQEELRQFPHPRSHSAVEALARWRGATVGVAAAEAFVLGRHIH